MFIANLSNIFAEGGDKGPILALIEQAAIGIEVLAVAIILISVVVTTANYIYTKFKPMPEVDRYRQFRTSLARALLLGLEVLIAADVVRTVVLDPTIQTITILGLLVVIRTFLSWSLVIEIESHWPWQGHKEV